ncbi:odorant receptor 131-2-like [Chelmon rostratus]|uniref:odorant receptor 131-2-like n=1 Tax=Chelmon rostratus TaxID=109905 RepID=UPI001BE637D9|nr:odorant receptor 131-2-like [Chelmon rostratus]
MSQINITFGLGILERVMFSTMSTLPCCVFLFINGTMLFTLRSKSVFRETSRYVLLYNLLFADTVQLVQGQLLYIIAACRVMLTYPVCGVLTMLSSLTTVISPLTLVVMSLERYVAVCYPLRHATIITIRNTGLAIAVVWAFSSLNVLIRVLLLLDFPYEDLQSLQMKEFCSTENMLLGTMSHNYEKVFTYCLFILACVAIISSYIGVMVAARSASTDKASARKARNTLLLHLVQLGLSLSSAIYNPLLVVISKVLHRIVLVRIQIVVYTCVVIFPRCLSAFIYGIRDQTIRPIFICHLCCQLKLSVIAAKAVVSVQDLWKAS